MSVRRIGANVAIASALAVFAHRAYAGGPARVEVTLYDRDAQRDVLPAKTLRGDAAADVLRLVLLAYDATIAACKQRPRPQSMPIAVTYDGAFSEPGAKQQLVWVEVGTCWGPDTAHGWTYKLAVIEHGRLIARMELVGESTDVFRITDLDGDGRSEVLVGTRDADGTHSVQLVRARDGAFDVIGDFGAVEDARCATAGADRVFATVIAAVEFGQQPEFRVVKRSYKCQP